MAKDTITKDKELEEIKNPVYVVLKPYGNRRKGEILEPSREVRRKLKEIGTIKIVDKSKLEDELKKMAPEVKNKMQVETAENKGAK